MFNLDYTSRKPVYEQIKDMTKEMIVNGVFKENDRLPSVREVASALAINPNTIQKAYKELEIEGYIYSQRAKGYFVAPIKSNLKKLKSYEKLEEFEKIVRECIFLGVEYDEIMEHIDAIYKEG